MTDINALKDLRQKVAAGHWVSVGSSAAAPREFQAAFAGTAGSARPAIYYGNPNARDAWDAYYGSMNAAISFVSSIAPDLFWVSAVDAHDERYALLTDSGMFETDEVYNENASRGLLLAGIDALIAQGEDG